MPLSIPQTDPGANYRAHADEIRAAVQRVLDGGWYILGREVAAFESEFAAYLGAAAAIGTGSGTEAIHLALRACGIGPGDAVVTVSHTAVATVAAIELAGAVPVFADIDPATFTLDPESMARAIAAHSGPRLRAVIPVHIYGHPANMPAILEIAARHSLTVIEDCAQSTGASLDGRITGTFGHIAAFSFYPTKNLAALGDGGAVVTSDPALAERARALREYGWKERYISDSPGMNTRLDELQAAILRVKLRYLEDENRRRRSLAERYDARLSGATLQTPSVGPGAVHAWHQYVIRHPRRDELKAHLRAGGVGALIHYPQPVHRQPAYRDRFPASLPHTEHAAREILSLPMYPELTAEQIDRVAGLIRTL